MYDIIIIGAGPAGLTAAIYALRAGKSCLVIEKGAFGGQISLSPKLENYPGFTEISGTEFSDRLVEQALALGADSVIMARPYVTALYGGEAEGVKVLTDKIQAELADTMAMCGVHSLKEITRDLIF